MAPLVICARVEAPIPLRPVGGAVWALRFNLFRGRRCSESVEGAANCAEKDASATGGGRRRQPASWRAAVVNLVVLALLTGYTFRTVRRNKDWENEESLFLSSLDVCADSAKVPSGVPHSHTAPLVRAA